MQIMSRYNYSKTEIEKILKTMVVLTDSNEQENRHILDSFDSKGISHMRYKLRVGDYSAMIPANEKYGIIRDIYYDHQISIERKNSLEELSTNLGKHRQDFANEFLRAKNSALILMIEQGSYNDIIEGNYYTGLNKNSYLANIVTFQHRYNLNICFVTAENAFKFIYSQLYYFLREQLV